jgi:hypothetical protein
MGIDHLPRGDGGGDRPPPWNSSPSSSPSPSPSSEKGAAAAAAGMGVGVVEETMGEPKRRTATEAVMLPASMVLVQAFTMGALLLSKLALNVGMEPFVLLTYRNLIGAIVVAPFAFYFDRYVRTYIP